MSARDEMLARIRTANAAAGAGPTGRLVPPVEVQHGDVDLFCENVADYRATVVRTREGEVAGAIGRVVGDLGIGSLLVPAGADPDWTTALGPEVSVLQVDDGTAISHDELGAVGATLTSSSVSIARTGTIILDHSAGQGRRELTLVPDRHICVVAASTVVDDVPDAVARLAALGVEQRPLTWISGPSATSDIELDRVEGVHGPRTLVVIVVDDD